jgi:nucleoside-diphosphate-sugar epimerase
VRIFVTGATGYIGFAVAKALRRAGHELWGLTRAPEKARLLELHEIHPVIGSMQKPESYLAAAEGCSVMIHAAVDPQADRHGLDRLTVERLMGLAMRGRRPKTFVYTAGSWDYGSTGMAPADESTLINPLPMVAPRIATAEIVLSSNTLRTFVIRPSNLYGKRGGSTSLWFEPASRGESPLIVGNGENFWAQVHVDDVADLYVRVVESGLEGGLFNVSDRTRWRVKELAAAAARAAGYTGPLKFTPLEEARKTMGPMADALVLDQHIDASKAARLLKWQPRQGGFVDQVDSLYMAWKAAQA